MATDELVRPEVLVEVKKPAEPFSFAEALSWVLSALASLRLTVTLFALAIFLIFAGTLAQVDHGVWHVVNHAYFRVWIAHIDWQVFERLVQVFRPVEWHLRGGFLFPGGKSIGILLLVNLLAAHGVRFKVAASGRRLYSGLALIGLGAVITALAVRSGLNGVLESELSPRFCSGLWYGLKSVLPALILAGVYLLIFRYDRIRRFEWWLLLAGVTLFTVLTVWLVADPQMRLDNTDLRILWQLIKGLGAGAVLLVGCVMVFRQRAGVVLLHGGVALLMFSELLTGISAQESQMTIAEGQSVNYSQDIRTSELAVVDHLSNDQDHVTVVPKSLLVANVGSAARIENSQLPFEIQVHQWLPNSRLIAPAAAANPATAGLGQERVAQLLPNASGVDADAAVDMPSAYVELFSKSTGQSLGTFLLSSLLPEQPVEVEGHTYDVALRFERIYYPFALKLDDFRFDRYMGTNTAKNYSSTVNLQDPARNVDRRLVISMNNPLRYGDLTFYQASFDSATEKTTVLQAVRNAGWMIPYVACMFVLTGMLAHFGVALTRFSRRRAEEAARQKLLSGDSETSAWERWFPAIVVAFFALFLANIARMPHSGPSEMQIEKFAMLPVAYQGRVKPYDTLARNTLQVLSGRQEVIGEVDGKRTHMPAVRWLLDVISGAKGADEHRVFRIDNLEVLDMLGLKPREGSFRYSLAELRDKIPELDKQIKLASSQPEGTKSLYQIRVLDLARKLNLYGLLTQSFQAPQIRTEEQFFTQDIRQVQQDIERLRDAMAPRAVPPMSTDVSQTEWKTLKEAELEFLLDRVKGQQVNPATVSLATLLDAYAEGDVATFNKQLIDYRRDLGEYDRFLASHSGALREAGLKKAEIFSQRRADFEDFFNHFSPFYYAASIYFWAFLLSILSFLVWAEPLRRAAFWLLVFTFVVHTLALIARIYVSGRPPVINLYSTAVFIGWGCVLLALLLEIVYRLGLGNLVASVIGFLTLILAHFLSLDGDTMIVMQAVLDTQFWLTTHVLAINLGYAATYLAGGLGIAYIVFVHMLSVFDENQRRMVVRMIYGTLCFAIFFSFIGTVLGGLWADNSWGRFWGWDPKENGALMIVLFNALILHARWGGMVKGRGLALLAIGGNIVTTWSYFGTNELGVGLHSYGASESSTAMWLLTFTVSQLVLIALGATPKSWWQWGERASAA